MLGERPSTLSIRETWRVLSENPSDSAYSPPITSLVSGEQRRPDLAALSLPNILKRSTNSTSVSVTGDSSRVIRKRGDREEPEICPFDPRCVGCHYGDYRGSDLAGYQPDRRLRYGFCVPCCHLRDPVQQAVRLHQEELRVVAQTLEMAYQEGEVEFPADSRPVGSLLFERWVLCENRLSGNHRRCYRRDVRPHDGPLCQRRREKSSLDGHRVFAVNLPAFLCIPRSWSHPPDRLTFTSISFDPREADQFTLAAVTDFQNAYMLGLGKTATESEENAARRLFSAHYYCWRWRNTSGGTSCRPTGFWARGATGLHRQWRDPHSGTKPSNSAGRRCRRCLTPSPPSPRRWGWMWAAMQPPHWSAHWGLCRRSSRLFRSGVAVATTLVSPMRPHGAGTETGDGEHSGPRRFRTRGSRVRRRCRHGLAAGRACGGSCLHRKRRV